MPKFHVFWKGLGALPHFFFDGYDRDQKGKPFHFHILIIHSLWFPNGTGRAEGRETRGHSDVNFFKYWIGFLSLNPYLFGTIVLRTDLKGPTDERRHSCRILPKVFAALIQLANCHFGSLLPLTFPTYYLSCIQWQQKWGRKSLLVPRNFSQVLQSPLQIPFPFRVGSKYSISSPKKNSEVNTGKVVRT